MYAFLLKKEFKFSRKNLLFIINKIKACDGITLIYSYNNLSFLIFVLGKDERMHALLILKACSFNKY